MTTHAKTTKFCATEVQVTRNHTLWIDGNQKITAGNGTYEDPKPNAFSILAIKDCPNRTPTCEAVCYVANLRKFAPDTYELHRRNSETIKEIIGTYSVFDLAAQRLSSWIAKNCTGGFRWHVGGDVFSERYAEWIVDVCRNSPNVRHWIYTRSNYAFILQRAENLTVNLSADADNWGQYIDPAELTTTHGFRFCYLTVDGNVPNNLPPGSVIFPDYGLRGRNLDDPKQHEWWKGLTAEQRKMVCPVDFFGASPGLRCGPCRKCIDQVGGR